MQVQDRSQQFSLVTLAADPKETHPLAETRPLAWTSGCSWILKLYSIAHKFSTDFVYLSLPTDVVHVVDCV